jgi:hypothetical protein
MNIIFQIEGGIGKSIMATAVCERIKKEYPDWKLIVITAYPDVFLCNPNVDKCFRFDELKYFYSEYIDGKTIKTFLHNPYLETKHILQKEHLLETWCGMFGMEYSGEMPKLYLTNREKEFYQNNFKSEKPILALQTNGGAENQEHKYSWARDMPYKTAQYIVNVLSKDYNIVHIRRENQVRLENTTPIHAEFRMIAGLIQNSTKRLFIDSFAQHTAKALDLDSVVCWVANSPKIFGYDSNENILANEFTNEMETKNSVFSKFNIAGDFTQFPYNSEDEIFDVERIIEAVKK